MRPQTITYVTSSSFKQDEADLIQEHVAFADGTPVGDLFRFDYRNEPINEILEVDLHAMVEDEVVKAYGRVRLPCIVEHAGLIFEEYADKAYPGGLTKPMWNTLGERFLEETASAGRRATARAVVAYCDGASVATFVGETQGVLADQPRGSSQFYWDTVFVPDGPNGTEQDLTYAEIVDQFGLIAKVTKFSQSRKAIMGFLEHRRTAGVPLLWR